jgi:hypothetical protein
MTGRHIQVIGRDVASRNLPNILLIFLILPRRHPGLLPAIDKLL